MPNNNKKGTTKVSVVPCGVTYQARTLHTDKDGKDDYRPTTGWTASDTRP